MKSKVIWSGASLLDGNPIVVIAVPGSSNKKTGDMLQTYILRHDIDPRVANATGADYSICGNCPHRGEADPRGATKVTKMKSDGSGETFTSVKLAKGRSCYVNIGQGVLGVWKAYKRGSYKPATAYEIEELGAGKMVRLGTYGDPAAVPAYVWASLLEKSEGHTGYSHQWQHPTADFQPALYMASVDSEEQAKLAQSKGYRTFRVTTGVSTTANEVLCPASAEAGKRTTCNNCHLCGGTTTGTAKSISIPAHGTGKGNFIEVVNL